MKQSPSIWFFLIGSLIALAFCPTLGLTQTSQDQIESEEYDVSSVALEHFSVAFLGKRPLIVISGMTVAGDGLQAAIDRIQHPELDRRGSEDPIHGRQVDSAKLEEAKRSFDEKAKRTLENPKAFADAISDQTTMDWTRRNYVSSILSNRFHLGTPVVILSKADADRLRKTEGQRTHNDFWPAFRKTYPEAGSVIVSISRVGFNPEHTQAIIEIGYATGPLGGEGQYLLLSKVNGLWQVRYLLGAWIS